MSDVAMRTIAWIGISIHLVVGVLAARNLTMRPLVAIVNAVVAISVLAYWMTRWYSYLFQGIKWYASDQALPVYAAIVLTLSVATLVGSFKGAVIHGVILSIDGLALLAAALFLTFFRMNRLF